jgi:hypothetical protein
MKMAISPVTQTDVTAVASSAAATPVNKEATQSKPQPTVADTVQLSGAAQAAFQEATETTFQTDKEARSGDVQAKRIEARQAAAEEAKEPPAATAQEAQGTTVANLR